MTALSFPENWPVRRVVIKRILFFPTDLLNQVFLASLKPILHLLYLLPKLGTVQPLSFPAKKMNQITQFDILVCKVGFCHLPIQSFSRHQWEQEENMREREREEKN